MNPFHVVVKSYHLNSWLWRGILNFLLLALPDGQRIWSLQHVIYCVGI